MLKGDRILTANKISFPPLNCPLSCLVLMLNHFSCCHKLSYHWPTYSSRESDMTFCKKQTKKQTPKNILSIMLPLVQLQNWMPSPIQLSCTDAAMHQGTLKCSLQWCIAAAPLLESWIGLAWATIISVAFFAFLLLFYYKPFLNNEEFLISFTSDSFPFGELYMWQHAKNKCSTILSLRVTVVCMTW